MGEVDEHKHQDAKKKYRSADVRDTNLEYSCIRQQAEEDGAAYVLHGGKWSRSGSYDPEGDFVAGDELRNLVAQQPPVFAQFTMLPPKPRAAAGGRLASQEDWITPVGRVSIRTRRCMNAECRVLNVPVVRVYMYFERF